MSNTETIMVETKIMLGQLQHKLCSKGLIQPSDNLSISLQHKNPPTLVITLPCGCLDTFNHSSSVYLKRELTADELAQIAERHWPNEMIDVVNFFLERDNREIVGAELEQLQQVVRTVWHRAYVGQATSRINLVAKSMYLPFRITVAEGGDTHNGPYRFFRIVEL